MIWNDLNAKSRTEVRDEQEQHDAEVYQEMYAEVEKEFWAMLFDAEIERGLRPDGARIHDEVMRRLREKYSQ